ncbi:hypothetical protein H1R20_g14339, partial [Candolleomyces eurysporus]
MLPHFPSEIIELIVDELAVSGKGPWKGLLRDVKSCCLAATIFVPHCQKHIFRSITLHPPRYIIKSSKIRRPYLTRRFSRVINQNPRLALYVQVLNYRASLYRDSDDPDIPCALHRLRNVVELNLAIVEDGAYSHMKSYGDPYYLTYSWQQAIAFLINRPQLRILRLKDITSPADDLFSCTELVTLELENAKLVWFCDSDSDEEDEEELPEPECTSPEIEKIYLREMKVGPGTTDALHKLLNPPKAASDRVFDFSQLIRLSVTMEEATDYEKVKPLLEGAKCLQDLSINVDTWTNNLVPDLCLKNLEGTSLSTLLSLKIDFTLLMNMPQWVLADPYFGLCDEGVLPNLTALRELKMRLVLGDYLNVSQSSFSNQWGRLDQIVVSNVESGWFSNFRTLELGILIRVKEFDPFLVEDSMDDAQRILENVSKYVYPRQFAGLRRLEKLGRLQFSFDAEMEILDCYTSNEARQFPSTI